MQVFDFTNGKRGRKLGDTKRPEFMGSTYHDGKDFVSITIADCGYHRNAGWGFPSCEDPAYRDGGYLTPEAYGVEAICFCLGEMSMGDQTFWDWNFLATPEWMAARGYPDATTPNLKLAEAA